MSTQHDLPSTPWRRGLLPPVYAQGFEMGRVAVPCTEPFGTVRDIDANARS